MLQGQLLSLLLLPLLSAAVCCCCLLSAAAVCCCCLLLLLSSPSPLRTSIDQHGPCALVGPARQQLST
jgi:hypothetical protein